MKNELILDPTTARRLAITRQRLAGPRPPANAQGIMELFQDLRCVQIDPIRAVERTQYLVLWSRLGPYDPAALSTLLWEERRIFEYWAHAASIVLTEDFPIYWRHMRDWATGDRPWSKRARAWMDENQAMRDHILLELERNGPMMPKEFRDESSSSWRSSGWTNGDTVRHMLAYLWEKGEIFVSGRKSTTKIWDLRERVLPEWTPREDLDWSEVVYRSAAKSIRALGVGRAAHIERHFTRGNYPDLQATLDRLEADGRIKQAAVVEDGQEWPGPWYIHVEDLPLLAQLQDGDWQPRTTLLSPFDNLICDRDRTQELFDFHFRIEIYVPAAKRQYGYYVLPILHGERLIGRIDPKMDRKAKRLDVHNVYAEPGAPKNAKTGRAVAQAVEELATFLGAEQIVYGENVPAGWREALR
jgi:uncharacterized protein YcaQ